MQSVSLDITPLMTAAINGKQWQVVVMIIIDD